MNGWILPMPPATTQPALLAQMAVLTDPVRARMLRLLESHELTVAELCRVLQLPQSTASRHLKQLAGQQWVISRREGTATLYRLILDELDTDPRKLWLLVREQVHDSRAAQRDDLRLQKVLADRQTKSEAFFQTAAGQWDKVRDELFGNRFDLAAIAGLLDPDWAVGDIGCGTGQISEAVAPFVREVYAVDSSAPMLKAARKRLAAFDHVTIKRGSVESLPIDDAQLDAATCVLVLHHLPDPAAALADIARVLKPGGRLLVVDMLPHDHREYQQTMGHQWLGISESQLTEWLDNTPMELGNIHPLVADTEAKGPALFAAAIHRTR